MPSDATYSAYKEAPCLFTDDWGQQEIKSHLAASGISEADLEQMSPTEQDMFFWEIIDAYKAAGVHPCTAYKEWLDAKKPKQSKKKKKDKATAKKTVDPDDSQTQAEAKAAQPKKKGGGHLLFALLALVLIETAT